jgi:hypothetical protein
MDYDQGMSKKDAFIQLGKIMENLDTQEVVLKIKSIGIHPNI